MKYQKKNQHLLNANCRFIFTKKYVAPFYIIELRKNVFFSYFLFVLFNFYIIFVSILYTMYIAFCA